MGGIRGLRLRGAVLRDAGRRVLALPVNWAARAEGHARAGERLEYAPLFIIGPPRSGTTLVYQSICHSLEVAYPTNLMVDYGLDRGPSICRILHGACGKLPHRRRDAFSSDYGATKGLAAPSEAGPIWNRWFCKDTHYTPEGVLDAGARRAVYRSVANMERVFGAPFVNKNVKHSVRIRALVEVFSDAIFLEVTRDPLMAAQSIFLARSKRFRSSRWWSVKPKESEDLVGLSLAKQAAAQVFYIRRCIAQDRERVGSERFFSVAYEAFCRAPNAELERIAKFMAARGAPAGFEKALPDSFPCACGPAVPEETSEEMRRFLSKLDEGGCAAGASISKRMERTL